MSSDFLIWFLPDLAFKFASVRSCFWFRGPFLLAPAFDSVSIWRCFWFRFYLARLLILCLAEPAFDFVSIRPGFWGALYPNLFLILNGLASALTLTKFCFWFNRDNLAWLWIQSLPGLREIWTVCFTIHICAIPEKMQGDPGAINLQCHVRSSEGASRAHPFIFYDGSGQLGFHPKGIVFQVVQRCRDPSKGVATRLSRREGLDMRIQSWRTAALTHKAGVSEHKSHAMALWEETCTWDKNVAHRFWFLNSALSLCLDLSPFVRIPFPSLQIVSHFFHTLFSRPPNDVAFSVGANFSSHFDSCWRHTNFFSRRDWNRSGQDSRFCFQLPPFSSI